KNFSRNSRPRESRSNLRMGSRKGSSRFDSGTRSAHRTSRRPSTLPAPVKGARMRPRHHSVNSGLSRRVSRNHQRTIFRHTRLLRRTGRIALRGLRALSTIHAHMNAQGTMIYSLGPSPLSPLYSDKLSAGQLENSNRYLGIIDGVSPLRPLFARPGQYISYVLINNRTGAIVWDSQIWIPQGESERNLEKLLHHLFSSVPRTLARRVPPPKPAPKSSPIPKNPTKPTNPEKPANPTKPANPGIFKPPFLNKVQPASGSDKQD
ncbi:hypothetical protein KKF84_00210, partial [Myxococcota bacterium]|nr:hypothetical protein [Myxococcota bacterium]